MPALRESATSDSGAGPGERVLIVGVNWIGDAVMSMPAIQSYRQAHPGNRITLLVKPALAPLWALHRAPDEILTLGEGFAGIRQAAQAAHRERFARAFVLPHSFRSALVPWLAEVPARIGMPGHWRDWMLTSVIRPTNRPGRIHQAYEYLDLLRPEQPDAALDPPALILPDEARAAAVARLAALPRPCVALIPGAARGPAKQWPAGHFVELGRKLTSGRNCGLVVLGISREAGLCGKVASGIGPNALNLAGHTSLAEWIAVLGSCDLVVANDSGGMHLAAAVGTPLVAVYGITDPAKTGPIGRACRILQNSETRSRDVDRDSPEAIKCLASILPEQVYRAALESLAAERREPGGK